jgi:hypothetical protein
MSLNISVRRDRDSVLAAAQGSEPLPVKILWMRPVSGAGKEISVLNDKGEVAFAGSPAELDTESLVIASDELSKRYFYPLITRIRKTEVYLGNRYFHVETDCGPRSFIIKNPYIDIRPVGVDGMLIRDCIGNFFKILSVAQLDKRSQQELEKVT